MGHHKHYLFNYAFIASLLLLVLNDHIFKAFFHNGVTGKLSDVAGMVVLPLLLAFLFPRLKTNAVWLSMVLFAFWKTPLSQPIIDAGNTVLPFEMGRVVDYTDLWAFVIVPLPYLILKNVAFVQWTMIRNARLNPVYFVLPSLVALIATTLPRDPNGEYDSQTGILNFRYLQDVTVNLTHDEILRKFNEEGIRYAKENANGSNREYPDSTEVVLSYYKIETLIIDKDTLNDVRVLLEESSPEEKTTVYLGSITINKNLDDKVDENKRIYYRELLERYFENLD